MSLVDFNLGDVGQVFKDLREAITGESIKDPQKMAEIQYKLGLLENQVNMGQIAINKVEAGSRYWFVAAWRPFIGWVCGVAIAYNFLVQPTVIWYANFHHIVIDTPNLDMGTLITLVLAMLGIGGMRSYEKLKGIDTRKISSIKPTKEEKY